MLRASDFRVDNVHAVAFIAPSNEFSAAALLASTMGASPPIVFDGEVSVFPLPSEVPPEIPRVTLKTSDKRWTLNASPSRIEVIWASQGKADIAPNDLFYVGVNALLRSLGGQGCVKRLGLILTRACEIRDPAKELIDHFCAERFTDDSVPLLRHSKAFELHNLKNYKKDEFQINSWVRCRTGHYKSDPSAAIVVFQHDINTPEDQDRNFQPDEISRFYEMTQAETDNILRLYFQG